MHHTDGSTLQNVTKVIGWLYGFSIFSILFVCACNSWSTCSLFNYLLRLVELHSQPPETVNNIIFSSLIILVAFGVTRRREIPISVEAIEIFHHHWFKYHIMSGFLTITGMCLIFYQHSRPNWHAWIAILSLTHDVTVCWCMAGPGTRLLWRRLFEWTLRAGATISVVLMKSAAALALWSGAEHDRSLVVLTVIQCAMAPIYSYFLSRLFDRLKGESKGSLLTLVFINYAGTLLSYLLLGIRNWQSFMVLLIPTAACAAFEIAVKIICGNLLPKAGSALIVNIQVALQAQIPLNVLTTHNNDTSSWICIDGVIYDITHFIAQHPGGSEILKNVRGQIATKKFHSVWGHKRLNMSNKEFLLSNNIGRIGILIQ
jgi:hypothetical protein